MLSSEVLATIPVGLQPRWVAIAPDGSRAYVTLDSQTDPPRGAVAVIGTQANMVTATIAVGPFPCGVVIAPDGRRVYVPSLNPGHGPSVVSVIDTGTNAVIDSITVGSQGSGPSGVAITPDGRHVYVASGEGQVEGQGTVSVIDTASSTVTVTIRGNPFPSTVTITPSGNFAYVLDTEGNPEVIDTTTHESAFPLERVISGTGRMAFTPDGLLAYVVGDGSDIVEVLEVATNRLVTVVDVSGSITTDVAVAPDGHHVYATQRSGESPLQGVRVIDTATQKTIGSPITWSGSADGLAITPNGLMAYVSDRHSHAVQVISL